MTHIYQWSSRLLAQYNDFLDLSRLETDILELELKKISLRDIVQTMVLDMKNISPHSLYSWHKAIQLETEIPENLPEIWADPYRIRHILFECIRVFLISAARVNVDIEIFTLSFTCDDRVVKIRISSPDRVTINQDFITELTRFETDMPVSKIAIYDMGIFIAHGLVKLHNGSMVIKNEVDTGGNVNIILPIKQSEPVDENKK